MLPQEGLSERPPFTTDERGVDEGVLPLANRKGRAGEGRRQLQDSEEDLGRKVGDRGGLRAVGSAGPSRIVLQAYRVHSAVLPVAQAGVLSQQASDEVTAGD